MDAIAYEYLGCVHLYFEPGRSVKGIDLVLKLVGAVGSFFYFPSRQSGELKMGELETISGGSKKKAHLLPSMDDTIRESLMIGSVPPVDEIVAGEQRHLGLPHGRIRTDIASESTWGDVEMGCMAHCKTAASPASGRIEPATAGIASEENPDLAAPAKIRAICDLRRINLATRERGMYPTTVPTAQKISQETERLLMAFPGIQIRLAWMGMFRALKWARLRPEMSPVLVRGFDKESSATSSYFYAAFFVFHIGFVGPHGFFCMFTDFADSLHRSYASSEQSWKSNFANDAELLVDDSMMAEPLIGKRFAECFAGCDRACEFLSCPGSSDLCKLGVSGLWAQQQTMIGYELGAASCAISLPKAKIEGVGDFAQGDHFVSESTQFRVKGIQVFRRLAQRWMPGFFFRRTFRCVSESLLHHTSENGECAARPGSEIWGSRRGGLSHVRRLAKVQEEWGRLVATTIAITIDVHTRLSGPRGRKPVTRLTSDSKMVRGGVINWSKRDSPRSERGGASEAVPEL